MKTIKKGKKIKRASDKEAAEQAKLGWKYCPKSEWRERVRDAEKPEKQNFKKIKKKKS
jgi:hypothetical protein